MNVTATKRTDPLAANAAGKVSLIESDRFPFEFLSRIGERESWRKEIHRPIYHVHKWWAKRLGSVFRGILLGVNLEDGNLEEAFYQHNNFSGITVFDPFMGSGTTVGEAHKLGMTAFGRDINAVAVEAVKVALGPLSTGKLEDAFREVRERVGDEIAELYSSKDSQGRPCDVLYYFWVMQAPCPACNTDVDLFSSYVIARNAYPNRKPQVQILCPSCGDVFPGLNDDRHVMCRSCKHEFDPKSGAAKGAKARCTGCDESFSIVKALDGRRPEFRLYAKLVLKRDNQKEYLPATADDRAAYADASRKLALEVHAKRVELPSLRLRTGHNTQQAMNYGFKTWRDFFNDRQLLALSLLRKGIMQVRDDASRASLLTLFSGVLEFNNIFNSYKGEGTGAVRHMFYHHILKPERVPIEANVWGTPKSSGSFSGLFRSRLLRALHYRHAPTEVNGKQGKSVVCSPPFSGKLHAWPAKRGKTFEPRGVYLSCGDSSRSELPDASVDFVVTDPPFFDNVHYSELADFFYAWQQLGNGAEGKSTRTGSEVQDKSAEEFARKLRDVFSECRRVLKSEGMLVFTYHHSRDEGWRSLASAILGAGFEVVNSHPVKSEMSVAAPKAQAKAPIQLDIVVVCRKAGERQRNTFDQAMHSATEKQQRLENAGFTLSANDRKIILFGQLLTTLVGTDDPEKIESLIKRAARYQPQISDELAGQPYAVAK